MNKPLVAGLAMGIAIAAVGGGIARHTLKGADSADLSQRSSAAEPNCYEHTVTHQAAAKDDRRIAGTVAGAPVGGAVGKDVGDRDITTAAGAAVGALAGNQAQKKLQERRTYTTTETNCDPLSE